MTNGWLMIINVAKTMLLTPHDSEWFKKQPPTKWWWPGDGANGIVLPTWPQFPWLAINWEIHWVPHLCRLDKSWNWFCSRIMTISKMTRLFDVICFLWSITINRVVYAISWQTYVFFSRVFVNVTLAVFLEMRDVKLQPDGESGPLYYLLEMRYVLRTHKDMQVSNTRQLMEKS